MTPMEMKAKVIHCSEKGITITFTEEERELSACSPYGMSLSYAPAYTVILNWDEWDKLIAEARAERKQIRYYKVTLRKQKTVLANAASPEEARGVAEHAVNWDTLEVDSEITPTHRP